MIDRISQRFGPRLRELREARGMTQAALSRVSGVIQAQISRYESNLRRPSWSDALQLAAALDVPVQMFAEPNGIILGKTAKAP